MVTIALYQGAKDNAPRCVDVPWADLVRWLTKHEPTTCGCATTPDSKCPQKLAGPAWSPVEIEGTRSNENVRAITVAVFDLDHLTPQQAEALDVRGHAYACHSSHNHRPEDVCLRLALPLSRQVLPAEWPAVRAAAIRYLGLPADPATKDLSRLYFLPTQPPGAEALASSGDGPPLDVDALLAAKAGSEASASSQSGSTPDAATIGEGGRHDFLLRTAGRLSAKGLRGDELAAALHGINLERCNPPTERAEVDRILLDVAGYRARDAAKQDANAKALGLDQPRATPVQVELDAYRGRGEAARDWTFESGAELLTRELPKTPWLVRGVLTEGAVAAIAGEPKTQKTWSGMELAVALASGTPAFGQFPTGAEPRRSALFLGEDSPRSVRARLAGLVRGRGGDPAQVLARIHVKMQAPLNLLEDSDLCRLISAVRALPERPALVMLDPLRDLHTAEENDSGEMAKVMGNLRALRALLGCTVLFVHHSNKVSKDTEKRRPGQEMRGSSAIHAAVDGGLYLTQVDEVDGTLFLNGATVQLKAAKGAGHFTLRLELEDDDEGECEVARWQYAREETLANDLVLAVIQKCETAWIENPHAVLSVEKVAEGVGAHKARVSAALKEGAARGQLRRVLQGTKQIGFAFQRKTDV